MRAWPLVIVALAGCVSTHDLVVRDAGVSSSAHAVILSDLTATADELYRLEQDQVVMLGGDRIAVDKVRVAWAPTFAQLQLAAAVERRLAAQVVTGDAGAVALDLAELQQLETWIGAAIAAARNRMVNR